MKTPLLAALLAVAALTGCEKTVVTPAAEPAATPAAATAPATQTAVVPVPVPGPQGPAGEKGEKGDKGDTNTTVVVPDATATNSSSAPDTTH
jgi:hypothetical protein